MAERDGEIHNKNGNITTISNEFPIVRFRPSLLCRLWKVPQCEGTLRPRKKTRK